MKHFAKKNYDFTFFSQLCKDVYRKTGTYHLERVPENAKMGTYHLERVPENTKTGTYHLEHVPENAKTGTYYLERRARIFEKPDVAREKSTRQNSLLTK